MKTVIFLLFNVIFLFFPLLIEAQSVAICGYDGSGSSSVGDEISFVLLRDFMAGEVIYITEDEYSATTNSFLSGEGHIAYTVPAGGLLTNEVLNIRETSNGVYAEQCGSGGTALHVSGSGGWSLVVDGLGGCTDELYIYSASNPTAPWSSVTEIHSFAWASNVAIPSDQNPSTDYPNSIIIAFNIGGSQGFNADFKDAARVNTSLAMLQDGTNWTKTSSGITLSCLDFTSQMIALPVELINFSAQENDKQIMLNWSTASEMNNDYFAVEHCTDGHQFIKIDEVQGVGNSLHISYYDFFHHHPANGINYYRLKQVDYDGNYEYSEIISAKIQQENFQVAVFPNPFTESITLKIPFMESNNFSSQFLSLEVFDVFGKIVHSEKTFVSNPSINLNLSKLSKGTFFLQIKDEHHVFSTQRIMKLR